LGTIYSYFVYKGLSTTGQGLVNNNILAPKIRELQIGLQINEVYLKKLTVLIKFK
jgi:hypothetical protein